MAVAGEVATVGAGVRLGELYDALAEHGLTIPAGCGPSVGIAGLTLGGGLGIMGRPMAHNLMQGGHRLYTAGDVERLYRLLALRSLGLPLPQALETARRLIDARDGGIALSGSPSLQIRADVETLTNDLNTRLERAVEISPNPRRGRPRRK